MCDLNNAFSFRGFTLNTTTMVPYTDGARIRGCTLSTIDHSEVEIRQFTEPLALQNGIDVGGVWLGARRVRMTGTIYGVDRAEAFNAVAALTSISLPEPGTFGYYALALTEGTLYVRPHGLRVVWDRNMFGGAASMPLAVPWSLDMYAKNPDFA